MDLQSFYWLFGAVVAAISVYNFVIATGKRSGATDAQVDHYAANEKLWTSRFESLQSAFLSHQSQTAERFEKVVTRLNDALLMMAREHPTKGDLQQVKSEILQRIDSQYGAPRTRSRGAKAEEL